MGSQQDQALALLQVTLNIFNYLDGLGCGSLNLQPAGRIVQITNISVNFIVVRGLATE